jgi:hypothetical protein
MKANDYKVLIEAIERGVAYGHSRAYKHDDKPTDDIVKMCIEDAVITEILEWFDFDDEF